MAHQAAAGEGRCEFVRSREHHGLAPQVDTVMNAMQCAALAPNRNRVLVDPHGAQLRRGDQLELSSGDPSRGCVAPTVRPNKLKNFLNRDEFGEILGLRPSICTISDGPNDFVALFGTRARHTFHSREASQTTP
jgi:hypothetical protein